MAFVSILWPDGHDVTQAVAAIPACFRDLNLDQIVAAVTAKWSEYDLVPFFCVPLTDPDAVAYRHEIMRDLERESVARTIERFAADMREVRQRAAQAEKGDYPHEKARWRLDAAVSYCNAVDTLRHELAAAEPASRGLIAFRDHLDRYVASNAFRTLHDNTADVNAQLDDIQYTVWLRGRSVTVQRYTGERDYGAVVEAVFERFRRAAVRDYRARLMEDSELNHVEAQILDHVALLFPDPFAALDRFASTYAQFVDPSVARFDREIHFYVAYLAHIESYRRRGLTFCYPGVTKEKDIVIRDGFDLALAQQLAKGDAAIVLNDVHLQQNERILVVSGPNQGGKTTYARMFAQIHYLAALGCPVPAAKARLFLFDHVLTHFEREESSENLRGKLQDDLIRVRELLDQATSNSIIILNEIFASTTLKDAALLARQIVGRISDIDCHAVCVTFLTELATLSAKTVSAISIVDAADPTRRTFRIERRPAEGVAYAMTLARKHRVTHDSIVQRIR